MTFLFWSLPKKHGSFCQTQPWSFYIQMGIRARQKRSQWVSYWIPYPNTRRKHREPEEFIIYNTVQYNTIQRNKTWNPNKESKEHKKRNRSKREKEEGPCSKLVWLWRARRRGLCLGFERRKLREPWLGFGVTTQHRHRHRHRGLCSFLFCFFGFLSWDLGFWDWNCESCQLWMANMGHELYVKMGCADFIMVHSLS